MSAFFLFLTTAALVVSTTGSRRIQGGYSSSYGLSRSMTERDYNAIKSKLEILENKIDGVKADYGYGNVFSMHIQSQSSPQCPIGTYELWDGYSLVKAFDGSGYIDLSDPGSCMQQFDPVPNVLCKGKKCKLNGKNWKSTWLWDRENESQVMASRCCVCESAKTLLVVHSQNQTVPSCPTGYTSENFWAGYSFISTGQSGRVSLSSVGSCLPYFDSAPFIECTKRSCKNILRMTNYSHWMFSQKIKLNNVWLSVAGMTDAEKETVDSTNASQMISRCRVCALYTPSLWPRKRNVRNHDSHHYLFN
eukprot:sb/3467225/